MSILRKSAHLLVVSVTLSAALTLSTTGAHAAVVLGTANIYGGGYTGGIDGDPNANQWMESAAFPAQSTSPGTELISFGNTWTDSSAQTVTYSSQIFGGLIPGSTIDNAVFTGVINNHHDAIDPGSDNIWYGTNDFWIDIEVSSLTSLTYNLAITSSLNDAAGVYRYGFGLFDTNWNEQFGDWHSSSDANQSLTNTILLSTGTHRLEAWGMIKSYENNWSGGDLEVDVSFTFSSVPEPSVLWLSAIGGLLIPVAHRRRILKQNSV